MEKKNYIQPKTKAEKYEAASTIMQLVLGSPTGPEPGKTSAPKLVPKLGNDSVQVF